MYRRKRSRREQRKNRIYRTARRRCLEQGIWLYGCMPVFLEKWNEAGRAGEGAVVWLCVPSRQTIHGDGISSV